MKEVKEFLFKNKDPKYRDFSLELNIYHQYPSIGVRIPLLRNYAKRLAKEYPIDELINKIDEEYYEEILLKGFIIGNYNNLTYEELIYYINNHLPKIKDWSMCDTFASSLKITKKYLDKIWLYLIELLQSKDECTVRFALVMMLNYYINDEYQAKIYNVIKSVKNDAYYVKMANAWLLSYMFINYFDDTINFIKENKLNTWVVLKGISKGIESYKIDDENKKILKKLRAYYNKKD